MKKLSAILIILAAFVNLYAFEWPQENTDKEAFESYFAQERGNRISTSVIFKEPEEIKTAEDGKILIVLTALNDESDFFPSALGTTVIMEHKDDLISVYGNLESESLETEELTGKTVASGTKIARTGNTGWQKDISALEFQIIDTKKSSAINPKILMPRTDKEIELNLTGITIQDKNGEFYDLNVYKNFSSGLYRVFQKKNSVAAPLKTTVSVNGTEVDKISYDTISQYEEKVLTEVTSARAKVAVANSPEEMAAADRELTGAIGRLLAVAENKVQAREMQEAGINIIVSGSEDDGPSVAELVSAAHSDFADAYLMIAWSRDFWLVFQQAKRLVGSRVELVLCEDKNQQALAVRAFDLSKTAVENAKAMAQNVEKE